MICSVQEMQTLLGQLLSHLAPLRGFSPFYQLVFLVGIALSVREKKQQNWNPLLVSLVLEQLSCVLGECKKLLNFEL